MNLLPSTTKTNEPADQTTEAELNRLFNRQRLAYQLDPMPSLTSRRFKLKKLKSQLLEYRDSIAHAINKDFNGRAVEETLSAELFPSLQCIHYTLKHLDRWMRPSKRSSGLYFQPATSQVIYQPLGVIGIITPFNYPVTLSIMPLITALAAGNRVMLKLSEFTPQTALILREMLGKIFEEDEVAVVTGEAELAAAFSRLPFDHLLFTGSTNIGRHVMRAAAENLTPVTLELGGKSPAIIADDIPLEDIVDRICFAKSLNAGQTCVAPDYILIPRNKQAEFIRLFIDTFRTMYPHVKNNPDYTSLIHQRAWQRMHGLLKDAAEKGATVIKAHDEEQGETCLKITMHLVSNVTDEMHIMQEELFGPILPLVSYDHFDEAIAYVNRRPRPLALYLFSYDKNRQQQTSYHTHAGSMCINESLIHLGVDDLPFGGIGSSGMGQYHGHEGFLTFSKAKSVFTKGKINPTRLFYPPYGTRLQQWLIKFIMR